MKEIKPDVELERRALQVVEEVLEQEPKLRADTLETQCGDDPLLHSRVTTLLEHELAGELVQPDGMPNLADIVPEMCEEVVPGGRVGSYELVRPIARGGMGWVYEAIQDEPHRRVALKILRRGFESEVARGRFKLESEVLAFLKHPGIAQVYEAGVHVESGVLGANSMPFLALEFVEGARSITGYAGEESLEPRQIVELFLKACDAVHYGHLKGVIHRDLKPANILVGLHGKVKVIDFGIARVVKQGTDSSLGFTRTGQVLGTLGSMSPEQFGSDPKEVDVRSDVYSLGVVLFQLLTGERPFDLEGKSVAEVAEVVRAGNPITPRSLAPNLDLDLEAVVLKAINSERDLRYVSVLTLMEDLQRYLQREPVLARAPGLLQRSRLFVRRNPVPVGLTAALILVLSVATGVSVNRMHVAEDATVEAELATKKANSATLAMLAALKTAEEATEEKQRALDRAEAAAEAERLALEQERLSKADLVAFQDAVIMNINRRLAGWGVDLRNNTEILPISKLGEEDHEPGLFGSIGAIAEDLLAYPEGSGAEVSGQYLMALIGTREAQTSLFEGNYEEARDQYEVVQGQFAALHAAMPDDVRYAMGLADVTVALGGCAMEVDGDSEFLAQCLEEGIALAEGLGDYLETDPDCVNFIVFNYAQLGIGFGIDEHPEEAIDYLERSIELGLQNLAKDPDSIDTRDVLAYSYLVLATVMEHIGRFPEASERIDAAHELQLALVDEPDIYPSTFVDLAVTYLRRGSIYLNWADDLHEVGEDWTECLLLTEETLEEALFLIEDRLGQGNAADDEYLLNIKETVSTLLVYAQVRIRSL